TVITAATLSPEYPADGNAHADHDHPAGFNEHVFYDPAVMATLAQRIAADLGAIDPDGQAAYTANATTFAAGVDSIEASLAQLKAAHEGTGVFVTENLDVAAGVREPVTDFVAAHPAYRLIDGRFMVIPQAVGTPQAKRGESKQFLHELVEELKASGFVADALRRSGQTAPVAPPAALLETGVRVA
ncbi:MAG TPA: zinc ABC transporter substrate-binding protein, partial [Trebonia sp.]|nr:zinc ABC transporter substrate-binding protein [Trebonia sp.]